MNDLSGFLLARIAEDETECRQEIADGYGGDQHESGWSSNRVLAECEAKRRIVAEYQESRRISWAPDYTGGVDAAMRLLALPYADHPDYRDEWRP